MTLLKKLAISSRSLLKLQVPFLTVPPQLNPLGQTKTLLYRAFPSTISLPLPISPKLIKGKLKVDVSSDTLSGTTVEGASVINARLFESHALGLPKSIQ
ncbi:Uncharacterised protein [Vibrio cholerae]|uniref:Uncharacterized protein n=1 Tax=Vibrio cholerae TaxID=666 RepID=A0A655UG25_VIBCL|nr:Uncharacterised protein [Vibrio cholerae]CSB50292.1 Uncharacterised protein [Vibrio cholerae]CSB70297.1 Uncharacterised protein [Vibrio cholerae]CSC44504.1 Uncharacterised protein [Vibrio cholerae]CSC95149.1 Uncharacterised protein [Vibrio cholerae]